MTMVFSDFRGLRIMPDVFVMPDCKQGKNTYHFCGASLVGNRYKPNNVRFPKYYALNHSAGIGVTEEGVFLVQNDGKNIAVPGNFPEDLLMFPMASLEDVSETPFQESLTNAPSCWTGIKRFLRERLSSNQDAALVFGEITKWETNTQRTIETVRKMLGRSFPNNSHQSATIYAADQQWIAHGGAFAPSLAMMGYGEQVWGEIDSEIAQLLDTAEIAPLLNGWAVRIYQRGCLLIRGESRIETLNMPIPYGHWYRYGKWTFWPARGDVLSPNQQLILDVVRRDYQIVGATKRWLFGIAKPEPPFFKGNEVIIAVSTKGKLHSINSFDKYHNRVSYFGVGKRYVFVTWELPEGYLLSAEDTFGKLPLCPQWTRVLYNSKRYSVDAMGVIPGSPDVAVVLLTCYQPYEHRIFVVDADCNVSLLPPVPGLFWFPGDRISMKPTNNRIDIERVDAITNQTNHLVTLEAMGGKCLVMFPEPGVAMEVTMSDASSRPGPLLP